MPIFKLLEYLVLLCVFVFFLCLACIEIVPLYSKYFISYPKLEEAVIYQGTLSIEGDLRCKIFFCFDIPRKYYVNNKEGKHEIYYGVLGDRINRWQFPDENKATGTFWFNPTFGVIQESFKLSKHASTVKENANEFTFISYEKIKQEYEQGVYYKHSHFSRQFTWLYIRLSIFLSLLTVCYVIYLYIRRL
jgi:hypothetical protein